VIAIRVIAIRVIAIRAIATRAIRVATTMIAADVIVAAVAGVIAIVQVPVSTAMIVRAVTVGREGWKAKSR
jgi:hypothetical protein